MKKILYLSAIVLIIAAIGQKFSFLPSLPKITNLPNRNFEKQTVVYEESVITKVVEESLPSVVTVGINKVISSRDLFEINPFNPFSPFNRIPGKQRRVEENIGSGVRRIKAVLQK